MAGEKLSVGSMLWSIASLKVTVTVKVDPASLSEISASLTVTLVTVGLSVSMARVAGVAASLALSAASVNLAASTVTDPVPLNPSSAVKVA